MLYAITPGAIGQFFKLIGSVFYYLGYFFWFQDVADAEEKPPPRAQWYAWTTLKKQNIITSIVGIIAASFALAAFAIPILWLPAFWLYCASNILWTIDTYYQKNHPDAAAPHAATVNPPYLRYAGLTTLVSFCTALTATLICAFPPLTAVFTVVGVSIQIVLAICAITNLVESHHATTLNHTTHKRAWDKHDIKISLKSEISIQAKATAFFLKDNPKNLQNQTVSCYSASAQTPLELKF